MDFSKESQLKIIEIVNGTDFFLFFIYNLEVYIMTIKMKYLKD